ncbi:hypothetical protein HWB90_gp103 [Mycobacterium phage Fowlmouth]|uniref:Uncharacterized protein n=1 Tax=Mycobacterium phage Fowlmouth TaxID=2419978 RepID=A0A3G2KGC7_9CAUD|nr:hypothetical protein HWB90_gp103 [Mycobacterium phage Fowlmouth]AYN58036.1 hypothetical protein SEA_FOWLMOUTH_87 [Mycobacterium phage Fowlmouth]
MGKKKKKASPNRHVIQSQNSKKQYGSDPQEILKQQDSVRRLATMMQVMSAPPEPILSLLERLGILFEVVENVPGDPSLNTLVIKMSDLEAGEERNQAEGSLLARMYGKDDPAASIQQKPSTGGQLPSNVDVAERVSKLLASKGVARPAQRPNLQELLNQAKNENGQKES